MVDCVVVWDNDTNWWVYPTMYNVHTIHNILYIDEVPTYIEYGFWYPLLLSIDTDSVYDIDVYALPSRKLARGKLCGFRFCRSEICRW